MTRPASLQVSMEATLASAVARAIEWQHVTLSEALGYGLALWLHSVGEEELAEMVCDGRGLRSWRPRRHRFNG